MPVTFDDKLDYNKLTERREQKPRGIFAGSLFFPNEYGVRWFVQHVAPHVNAEILIIGKGFETLKNDLECDNVKVIGTVEDVSEYFYRADFVIAPIFEGSGMKLKTAEALMCGKTIFGTTEAFSGYALDFDRVGGLCNTAREFIDKINGYPYPQRRFNEESRKIYEQNYSMEHSRHLFRMIFEKI